MKNRNRRLLYMIILNTRIATDISYNSIVAFYKMPKYFQSVFRGSSKLTWIMTSTIQALVDLQNRCDLIKFKQVDISHIWVQYRNYFWYTSHITIIAYYHIFPKLPSNLIISSERLGDENNGHNLHLNPNPRGKYDVPCSQIKRKWRN